MRSAYVIVACVDALQAREAIKAVCRRYMTSLPGKPGLRCWFITDGILAAERQRRPPGYDLNPNAPGDPQVVSTNGTLASEACNGVLNLITGYSSGRRGARIRQYDGRAGRLAAADIRQPRQTALPA